MNGYYDAKEVVLITAAALVFAALLTSAFGALPPRVMRWIYLGLIPSIAIWIYLAGGGCGEWVLLSFAALVGYDKYWRTPRS